jgi:hypothetical protein
MEFCARHGFLGLRRPYCRFVLVGNQVYVARRQQTNGKTNLQANLVRVPVYGNSLEQVTIAPVILSFALIVRINVIGDAEYRSLRLQERGEAEFRFTPD